MDSGSYIPTAAVVDSTCTEDSFWNQASNLLDEIGGYNIRGITNEMLRGTMPCANAFKRKYNSNLHHQAMNSFAKDIISGKAKDLLKDRVIENVVQRAYPVLQNGNSSQVEQDSATIQYLYHTTHVDLIGTAWSVKMPKSEKVAVPQDTIGGLIRGNSSKIIVK